MKYNHLRILNFNGAGASVLTAVGVMTLAATASAAKLELNREFNEPGNILIADQLNNRVIEINPSGQIVWSYGGGPCNFTSGAVIGVNDAQRVGDYTLIAATGTPAGLVPQAPSGAVDSRVLLVDPFGRIVWQYGQFGEAGAGRDQLNTPVQSTWLPNGDVLITDQGNNRIIEVNLAEKIVWQYPGSNTNAEAQLSSPNSAELLANGHLLISDEGNSRAIEVTRGDVIVKTFSAGGTVNGVAFASRLEDGDTLITDSNNGRIVEVNQNDEVVWQYYTDTDPLSVTLPQPSRAVRLHDGDTLISDQWNNRVIRIHPNGKLVADYGLPLDGGGFIGNNFGYSTETTQAGLSSPYDAKVIGDYTGLTPPFGYVWGFNF